MKDIKFRAWDKENNIMYDDSCSGLVIHFDGKLNSFNQNGVIGTEFTEPLILMQYTGLKDKNGEEIYEGDILDITFEYDSTFLGKGKEINRGVVSWKGYSDGEYVDNVECWMSSEFPISDLETNNIKIVGDIYENPELLE